MPQEFNTLIPARGGQPSMFVELKTASHIFEAGEDSPFWNDIETRLPYYSITFLDLPAGDHAITLDDQRLVFHKASYSLSSPTDPLLDDLFLLALWPQLIRIVKVRSLPRSVLYVSSDHQ